MLTLHHHVHNPEAVLGTDLTVCSALWILNCTAHYKIWYEDEMCLRLNGQIIAGYLKMRGQSGNKA